MTEKTTRRRAALTGAFVVATVTLIAFLPALTASFVTWDDDTNFLNNVSYRGLGLHQLHWMWTTTLMGHYVPLSWMTLGLDYVVWGMNPAGYHLTNVLLHTANAVAVYFVARRILRLSGAVTAAAGPRALAVSAALAALVFSIHPLRVESVVWITERRDVLSGLFASLTVFAYLHAADASCRRNSLSYGLAVVLFAAAVLSKATTVTLPVVLLILNAYPLQRLGGQVGWRSDEAIRVYRTLIPFFALSVAASVMTFVALQHVDQLPPDQKVAVSAYSLAFYIWKTIVPTGLAPLYKMPSTIDPGSVIFVASYAVAIAMTAAAWIARRRRSGPWFAWLAFVVILFPMLGVHQNGPQIAADRYTYHASPIVGILVASGLAVVLSPTATISLVLSACLVLFLGALTWRQAETWHDSERMWSQVLAVDSTSSVAQTALANLLLKRNDFPDAIVHYRRSLSIDPGSPEAHDNLGVALARDGKIGEAIEEYRQTLRYRPADYEAENDLGVALSQTGDIAGAIEHYQRALTIKPDFADAQVNWGNALIRQQKLEQAIAHYAEAVRVRPSDADAERNWGVALAQQGKLADAVEHFRRAVAINPGDGDARDYLTRAAAQLERGRRP